MGFIGKIKRMANVLLYLPSTIYFNFKHLPIKQAIKLPVILYHPKISGKGKFIIEGEIKTGMIRLGYPIVSIFNGKGIIIENKGSIIFKGKTLIGANAGISIGKSGLLEIGENYASNYDLKIICYNNIQIGKRVRFGWNVLLSDTDLHSLKSEIGETRTKGFGKIIIGDEVWVGSYSKLYKNTEIPYRCTVAANTLVNKKIECGPYSLIYSGTGIKVKHTGYYRDIDDDKIDYSLP